MHSKCLIVQVWESLLSHCYMNWQRKKTDISVNEKNVTDYEFKVESLHQICLPSPACMSS